MSAVINNIDAFYLGNDIPLLEDGPDQRALQNQIFSPDGVDADRTVSITEFSYKAMDTMRDPRYPLKVYIGAREDTFDSWVQHGVSTGDTQQQDVLGTNRATVDFVTPNGIFKSVAMEIVQTEDGHTFMVPLAPGTNGFNDYDKVVQGNEILSFSIRSVGTQNNLFTPPREPWTDGAFPHVDPPEPADGVVDGEETGETMAVGYDDSEGPTDGGGDKITNDDDVIEGKGGDDVISAGGGDDTVYGGEGDDTIYGDGGPDAPSETGTFTGPRESFNWDLVNSSQADSSVVQDTGDVNVTYTRIADTGNHESDIDNSTPLNTSGIDSGPEAIDTNSSLDSETGGNGNKGAFQWEFDEPVGNVQFNVNDLDGDGVVTVTAYGPDGEETVVHLTGGRDIDIADNTATATGGYQPVNDADINVQVSIDGPVSKIVLEHQQMGQGNSGIHITDMYFDTGYVPDPVDDGGDDTIDGGEGADQMFGEGGDDTFIVGSAAEGAGDVVTGGNGPDDSADNDTLDLRGAGLVTITETDDDTDAGATKGTVTFEDGSTLEYSQIETILLDPQDVDPVGNDDTATIEEDSAPVTINVLLNDTDPNGDPLTLVEATVPADQGGVEIVGNQVVFTPAPDFFGEATISYTMEDPAGNQGTASVAVTVTPVDDDPDLKDDTATTDFETPVSIDVLDNDFDRDGDILKVTAATVPADQGTVEIVDNRLEFTPADDFEGDATIIYTVSAGPISKTAKAVVTVGPNPADGVVDGEETGETMDVGYDDSEGPTDGGGDQITDGDDVIEGNGGDDVISAGGGDDRVEGGTGDDTIDGQDGDDTLLGNEGKDTIDGGLGDDTIYGGDDDDTLTGGDGNDLVAGGDGDDVIDTSGPVDLGNDIGTPDIGYPGVFPGDSDPSNDLDTVYGGAGDDVIRTGDDADTIYGGIGNDTINAGIDADYIDGGDGDDRIVGGEGSDTIEGGDGDDTIFAGNDPELGLDIYNIEDDGTNPLGPDLAPNNGQDIVYGGAGNDTISGADDTDQLYGGTGNDVIDGGIDDDTILGDEGDDTIYGGQGADELFGGLGSDRFEVDTLGHGTDDVIVGGEDPDLDGDGRSDEEDVLDLTGAGVASIAYDNSDPTYDPATGTGESGVVTFTDGGTLTFSEIETVIPCFTPGTLIATSEGERPVETLQPGDRVITRDNGLQEIAWVGARQMSGRELAANPSLKPVFVKAGSFGDGLPLRDMMLSPNHKVLLNSDEAQLYFDEREVFVAAKHMIGKPGIRQVDVGRTTYIHFMFERHEVVISDGAWTESFHPGDYSFNGIDPDARDEILTVFPELADETGRTEYRLARTELKKHEARLLMI